MIPAGDFSAWLCHAREALQDNSGADVPCGECIGCCSSSYFIHVLPEEAKALERMQKAILVAAPGRPKGHKLMGYDWQGFCPMLEDGKCSIYEHRPQTCRNYDCRVFAAAGIAAGGDDKAVINQRVSLWQFSYPTEQDKAEHAAVQDAARFIRNHAISFPGGRIPDNPSQLAILAIKVYEVFLNRDGRAASDFNTANAVIEASRKFDAHIEG